MDTPLMNEYLGNYPCSVHWQLFNLQLKQAENFITKERRIKAKLNTQEKIYKHTEKMRRCFLDSIGDIPDDDSKLAPKITGVIKRDKYRIEKTIYHSLEDFPITANLYIPNDIDTRAPAILYCCGHSPESKADMKFCQHCCMLAKNGFVVLNFDPIGQGERMQLIDRKTGVKFVRWGMHEHSYIGLLSTLSGQNIARYFVRDAIRSIDYLVSRDEVDSSRIGITGMSGGGIQTCYLMLCDPRISAAAPGAYVTERLVCMKMFIAQDAEQCIFGHIPTGFNYSDFFIAFAPKPVLLMAFDYDFFPIEGTIETYNLIKNIYSVFGANDNCKMTTDSHVHSAATLKLRQDSTIFFANVFMNKVPNQLDLTDDEPPEAKELTCTKSGQVLTDLPRVAGLMERIIEQIPAKSKLTGTKLRKHITKLVYQKRQRVPIYPRVIKDTLDIKQVRIEDIFFFSEPDLIVTGKLIRPIKFDGRKLGVTVVLLPDGSCSLRSDNKWIRIARLFLSNRAVFVFDVRGIASVKQCERLYDTESYKNMYDGVLFKLAYNSWQLGDNLVCQRAYDILRAIEMLRNRDDIIGNDIRIYGEDDVALAGLLAATVDGKVKSVQLKNLPISYKQAIKNIYYDRNLINEWTVIYGMLSDFDIPDLLDIINREAE